MLVRAGTHGSQACPIPKAGVGGSELGAAQYEHWDLTFVGAGKLTPPPEQYLL